jgi:chromosome partitioning protein
MVFRTVIPRSVRIAEAPSHGIPISLYSPSSSGAIAYRSLAEELLHGDGIPTREPVTNVEERDEP